MTSARKLHICPKSRTSRHRSKGREQALARRQLRRGQTYRTTIALSGSTVCLCRHNMCVGEPWTRVAGELNVRFRQISNRVINCLNQSLPVLLLALLAEGQTVQVAGTDLTIAVGSVGDFTSKGCLGGLMGCLDTVQLEVTRGNVSQHLTLSAVHTEIQRDQGVNRTKVFDHEITLVTLKNNQVVLNIDN